MKILRQKLNTSFKTSWKIFSKSIPENIMRIMTNITGKIKVNLKTAKLRNKLLKKKKRSSDPVTTTTNFKHAKHMDIDF